MVVRNTTNRITWATIVEVVVVVLIMAVAITIFDAIGAIAAAAALLIGRIGANIYLAPALRARGLRPEA